MKEKMERMPKSRGGIIEGMKELWRDTFGDSDEYLELIFNDSIDMQNCRWRADENGRIIASLVGIPYQFMYSSVSNPPENLWGLYLCGLATNPKYRKRGIMSAMLNEIEEYAKSEGFDFTFLIPADKHLREYYARIGYRESAKTTYLKYKLNNINTILSSVEFKRKYLQNINEIIDKINIYEDTLKGINILHNRQQIESLISDKIQSGGEIFEFCTGNGDKSILFVLEESTVSGSNATTENITKQIKIESQKHEQRKQKILLRPLVGNILPLLQYLENALRQGSCFGSTEMELMVEVVNMQDLEILQSVIARRGGSDSRGGREEKNPCIEIEDYGMVKILSKKLEKILIRENRIFENDRATAQKYRKISFRLMME